MDATRLLHCSLAEFQNTSSIQHINRKIDRNHQSRQTHHHNTHYKTRFHANIHFAIHSTPISLLPILYTFPPSIPILHPTGYPSNHTYIQTTQHSTASIIKTPKPHHPIPSDQQTYRHPYARTRTNKLISPQDHSPHIRTQFHSAEPDVRKKIKKRDMKER